MADGSAILGRSGSFRKRPLEATKSDGTEGLPPKHSERSPPSDHEEMEISVSLTKQTTSGLPYSEQQILDEVEEHFQRSLANVRGHSSKPRLLLQPANHHEQKSHHSHSSHSSHSHRHHSHSSHHHQSTTNTQYRTILPKPHPSDAHDIVLTENSVAPATTKQTSPSSAHSTHTPIQAAPSVSTTQSQQNVKQPVSANTTPGPQVISGSIPITTVAAISNIPTATQGLKIVDLVHSTNQKHSTTVATSAQPRTVPVATQNSIPGLVSVTQVPNMAAFSQHSAVSTAPQVPKMPVVASSAAPVSTAGSRSSRSPRKHTQGGHVPSTSAPSRPTPIPIPTQHQLAALAPQKTPTLTTVPTPPPIVPIIDPTMAQFTAGHSPILLVPGNFNLPLAAAVPGMSQPYVLVNPTDLGLQQAAAMVSAVTSANLIGTAPNFINAGGILSNPAASGYIVLPRSPFPTPMVNLAGTTIQQQAPGTSPTVTIMAETKPSPVTVSSPRVAPTKPSTSPIKLNTTSPIKLSTTSPIRLSAPLSSNPLRRSLAETSPGDISLTPASVEDHFAKALGEQWSKVKNNLQPQALAAQSSVPS